MQKGTPEYNEYWDSRDKMWADRKRRRTIKAVIKTIVGFLIIQGILSLLFLPYTGNSRLAFIISGAVLLGMIGLVGGFILLVNGIFDLKDRGL